MDRPLLSRSVFPWLEPSIVLKDCHVPLNIVRPDVSIEDLIFDHNLMVDSNISLEDKRPDSWCNSERPIDHFRTELSDNRYTGIVGPYDFVRDVASCLSLRRQSKIAEVHQRFQTDRKLKAYDDHALWSGMSTK